MDKYSVNLNIMYYVSFTRFTKFLDYLGYENSHKQTKANQQNMFSIVCQRFPNVFNHKMSWGDSHRRFSNFCLGNKIKLSSSWYVSPSEGFSRLVCDQNWLQPIMRTSDNNTSFYRKGLSLFRIHFGIAIYSLNCVWLFATPWTAAYQASQSFTNSWWWSLSLLKFMPTESMMPSNHLVLCHPLLLL